MIVIYNTPVKRLIIVLIIFQLIELFYFSYQIDQIKGVITDNANTANERANAFAKIILDMKLKTDKLP